MLTYLITGATSGLGHQVALLLARQGGHRLILPVRDAARGALLSHELRACGAQQVSTPTMDLASLPSVAAFLKTRNADAEITLHGVLMNAGVQSANRIVFTNDGFESTFAVNHLAHHLLLNGLLRSQKHRRQMGAGRMTEPDRGHRRWIAVEYRHGTAVFLRPSKAISLHRFAWHDSRPTRQD